MTHRPTSGSLLAPRHWWYVAREAIMEEVFADLLPQGARALEIGSADGPSTAWLRQRTERIATDLDPTGLRPGDVCARAEQLPFADRCFDVVAAFDVVEHIASEGRGLAELHRVLRPGGTLLVSVPAYEWAWTSFDDDAGHHRRYTRPRLRRALTAAGFDVVRDTHAFAAVFPFFALDRLRSRLTGSRAAGTGEGDPPRPVAATLRTLCRLDVALLRHVDLPFGSSVLAVARRPDGPPNGDR